MLPCASSRALLAEPALGRFPAVLSCALASHFHTFLATSKTRPPMVAAVDGPGRVRCAGGRLGIGAVVQHHANQNELCKYNPPHGFRALCKVPAS